MPESTDNQETYLHQTFIGANFYGLSNNIRSRSFILFAEGLLCTLIGIYIPVTLGLEEGVLISLFLASVPMSQRLSTLLEENRIRIWEKKEPSLAANRLTGLALLCMFLGVLSGYLCAVVFSMSLGKVYIFDFALEAANIGRGTILNRSFGSMTSIFTHNTGVLVIFMLLSFIYRSFGAMLALTWNASVWAIVLAVLIQRAMEISDMSPLLIGLGSAVAVLPHLCIEGIAYIFGSLSAIFLSQGVVRYSFSDPRFKQVLRACISICLLAVLLVALGAATEATVPPFVLGFLRT